MIFYEKLTKIIHKSYNYHHIPTILSFRTERSGQTVQTLIRLLLEGKSDPGLHHLPYYDLASLFEFKVDNSFLTSENLGTL